MKRLFLILILLLISFCGCGHSYGILDYQNKSIRAECEINNKYKAVITKAEDVCKISITEPKELCGIEFEITRKSALAIYDDVRIELDKSSLKGVCAIGSIFSQSEECLSSAKEQGDGSVLTFEQNGTLYQITLGEGSVPKSVKIINEAFEYDIEICAIELT